MVFSIEDIRKFPRQINYVVRFYFIGRCPEHMKFVSSKQYVYLSEVVNIDQLMSCMKYSTDTFFIKICRKCVIEYITLGRSYYEKI